MMYGLHLIIQVLEKTNKVRKCTCLFHCHFNHKNNLPKNIYMTCFKMKDTHLLLITVRIRLYMYIAILVSFCKISVDC